MAADINFGCCSSYKECSNKGKCIKPELMNNCNYWLRNLSNGINFYNDNVKKFDGFLYFIIDGRAFRIAYASSKGFSYSMSENEVERLYEQLKEMRLNVDISPEGYKCLINGTRKDPAYFRVNFKIGEKAYNIKNYNSYTITENEARRIAALLPVEYMPEITRWTSNGSFKIKTDIKPAVTPKRDEIHIEFKVGKIKKENGWSYQQLSFI